MNLRRGFVIGAAVVFTAGIAFASQDRITRTIDTAQTVVVKGSLLPLAQRGTDSTSTCWRQLGILVPQLRRR